MSWNKYRDGLLFDQLDSLVDSLASSAAMMITPWSCKGNDVFASVFDFLTNSPILMSSFLVFGIKAKLTLAFLCK